MDGCVHSIKLSLIFDAVMCDYFMLFVNPLLSFREERVGRVGMMCYVPSEPDHAFLADQGWPTFAVFHYDIHDFDTLLKCSSDEAQKLRYTHLWTLFFSATPRIRYVREASIYQVIKVDIHIPPNPPPHTSLLLCQYSRYTPNQAIRSLQSVNP